ncbi:SH3 domain-containing protein Dlish isoform X2 [Rhagoletis pomonella]|uniref:SH3 domain-containing protein Dlish isoform X1 n=1 Tax=Rhagoletis pomonella TaxID=28610 RepID=UPI00177F3667|nr:SH3 domain-containing protein Dlish isoform X1 [Rhagoletis pomonella]XP_036330805.1 SH3 domain-containing protein Dlish isoform X2 [Rhagoletis pomonella]
MAFLCPVRMRRDKKKATSANIERDLPIPGVGLGRITGSSSIETLVRVGIEKEHGLSPDSKMVILHDFTPCVDDELEVKRGQIVNILYRENDWVYVIGQDTRQEGFIPYSYCAQYNTQLADLAIKKKLPRDQNVNVHEHNQENMPLLSAESKIDLIDDVVAAGNGSNGGGSATNAAPIGASLKNSEISLILEPECTPFHKDPSGRYIVLYTFIARDENDLSVERGEFVTVLNREDPDWFWIVRSDGQEGFIPSAFVFPAESVLQTQQKLLNACGTTQDTGIGVVGGGAASNGVHKSQTKLNLELTAANLNSNLNSLSQTIATTATQLDVTCITSLQQQQQSAAQHQQQQQQIGGIGADDLRYHGTELVMLYDYKAQAPDDLNVRRGDWIYADLNNQTVDGWLWAYAPKTRKYGFIPKAYARPPAMTSL